MVVESISPPNQEEEALRSVLSVWRSSGVYKKSESSEAIMELSRLFRFGKSSNAGALALPLGVAAGAAACKLKTKYFRVAFCLNCVVSRCECITLANKGKLIDDVHAYGPMSINSPTEGVGDTFVVADMVLGFSVDVVETGAREPEPEELTCRLLKWLNSNKLRISNLRAAVPAAELEPAELERTALEVVEEPDVAAFASSSTGHKLHT